MLYSKHVTVIIPALNEQESIGKVIQEIPSFVDQILVVDNGSVDNTVVRSEEAGARVVVQTKKGYGIACLTGIEAAGKTDALAFCNGGYNDYPEDLVKVVEPVAKEDCDLAIGYRRKDSEISEGRLPHQKFGTQLACRFIHCLYGVNFKDLGPMRCFSANLYSALVMCDHNFGWTAEMQIKAIQVGAKIVEIPVRTRKRIGKSKIAGTVLGSLMAGYKIFYWIFRLKLFPHSVTSR